MPAVSARSIFATSGRSSSRQASESAPPDRSSSDTSAPRLRCASTMLARAARGPGSARGARARCRSGRVGAEAADDRPGGADRGLDVQARARVEVDEQHLALGQQRHADLERRGAGAGVEGEQRVVGLGGGQQLAAADLDGAELAAHQRLAAERRAGVEVDDRLEVGGHLPVREELGEPVGAAAVQQRLGGHRQRLLVGAPHGEQARALGLRERAEQLLEAVLPAGAGELEPLDGDVALDRLGRHVLDLVEHGGTVRQERHAVGAFLSQESSPEGPLPDLSAASAPGRERSDGVGGALAGELDRAAELALGLVARPLGVELVGDVREHQPPRLGAAPVLPGLGGRQVPARRRRARAAAASPRSAAGRCRGRTRRGRRSASGRRRRSAGRAVGGELDRVRRREVRHLPEAHAQRPDLEHVVRRGTRAARTRSRPGRRCPRPRRRGGSSRARPRGRAAPGRPGCRCPASRRPGRAAGAARTSARRRTGRGRGSGRRAGARSTTASIST